MYSLDVNFLKDRPEVLGKREAGRTESTGRVAPRELTPLFAGAGVAALLLALVGGLWYFANNSNNELEQQISEVNNQISAVDAKLGESRKIVDETNKITGETQALAGVFNQIKPWSAMMQDIRDRIPPGVAIASISEADVAPTPAAAPAPAPSPANNASPKAPNQASPATAFTTKVEITGYAHSFSDVNDFLLTLQRSSFLKKDQTQLVSAELKDDPTQLERPKIPTTTKSNTPQVTYELPKVVTYRIQTSLSDVPAADLLRELDRQGAVGLVTRIRTLQEQGVNP